MNEQLFVQCLDNTATPENWQNLGVLVFGRTFFPEIFDSTFSITHYNIIKQLLELYHPKRGRRTERQSYLNIHREAAKTTIASFLFPLYQIYFKSWVSIVRYNDGIYEVPLGERFIVLCSETATAAENLTTNIRTIIETRTDLIKFFGDKHPQQLLLDDDYTGRKGDTLWRKNAFITSDGTIVYGIGSGQQIRGKNVLNSRPTLVIVDDMYSSKSVASEGNRDKLDNWFFAELVNSADSMKGKIMWLGTLVHLDTVITKMKKSDSWFGVVIPIISITELNDALTHCTITSDEIIVPPLSRCNEIQNSYSTMSWKSRHTLHYILSLYKQAYENRNLRYFYQEYLNITEPPEEETFPDKKFLRVPLKIEWIKNDLTQRYEFMVSYTHESKVWTCVPIFECGVDIASGESNKSDDTAIMMAAIPLWQCKIPGTNSFIEQVRPLAMYIEGGKYGIYDDIMTNGTKKLGIADSLMRLIKKFPINRIKMEINGQQGTIVREVRRHLQLMGAKILGTQNSVMVQEAFSQGKKEERIRAVLEPLVQKYDYVIVNADVPLLDKMITQLQVLGSSDHEDYADAFAIAATKIAVTKKGFVQAVKPRADYHLIEPVAKYDWQTM